MRDYVKKLDELINSPLLEETLDEGYVYDVLHPVLGKLGEKFTAATKRGVFGEADIEVITNFIRTIRDFLEDIKARARQKTGDGDLIKTTDKEQAMLVGNENIMKKLNYIINIFKNSKDDELVQIATTLAKYLNDFKSLRASRFFAGAAREADQKAEK